MIAGLPGTGLGGLFFILSALAMPFVQVVRAARGEADARTWRLVVRHVSLASGMILGIDMAARLLHFLVALGTPAGASGPGPAGALREGVASFEVFGLPAAVVAIGALGVLLGLAALIGRTVRPADAPSEAASLDPVAESRPVAGPHSATFSAAAASRREPEPAAAR